MISGALILQKYLWRHKYQGLWDIYSSLICLYDFCPDGFLFGFTHAEGANRNIIRYVFNEIVSIVITPLSLNFRPRNESGVGESNNAWPCIFAAFILQFTPSLIRNHRRPSSRPRGVSLHQTSTTVAGGPLLWPALTRQPRVTFYRFRRAGSSPR